MCIVVNKIVEAADHFDLRNIKEFQEMYRKGDQSKTSLKSKKMMRNLCSQIEDLQSSVAWQVSTQQCNKMIWHHLIEWIDCTGRAFPCQWCSTSSNKVSTTFQNGAVCCLDRTRSYFFWRKLIWRNYQHWDTSRDWKQFQWSQKIWGEMKQAFPHFDKWRTLYGNIDTEDFMTTDFRLRRLKLHNMAITPISHQYIL